MNLLHLLLGILYLTHFAVSQSSNPCPFADGNAPFAALTGTVLQNAKNVQIQVTPYTAIVTLNGKPYLLSACNAPGTATPGSIQVPLSSVGIGGTGILGFIERLGKLQAVSSIAKEYCTSACSQGLIASNKTTDFIFGSDFATAIASEASPLAMFEWIVIFDAFFGFTGNSAKLVTDVSNKYSCMQSKVNAYKKSAGTSAAVIPTVLITQVDVSTNKVVGVANAAYWKALFTDAGAYPQFALDLASFTQIGKSADAVFDVTADNGISYDLRTWSTIYGLQTDGSQGYSFLDGFKSQIWRYDRRTASGFDDFLQSAPAQPEVVLFDVIQIFSTTYNPTFYNEYHWMRNLAMNAGYYQVMFSQCPSPPAIIAPDTQCGTQNVYEPDIGRFKFTNTTTGGNAGSSDGSSGGVAGFVFNVAAFIGSLAAIAVFVVVLVLLYKKYGNVIRSSGAMGTNSWLHESVQKRRWFRMAEEEELRESRRGSGEPSVILGNLRGARGFGRLESGAAGNIQPRQWQQEHGMPILPSDEH
ncbi:UNVERIFIED_CONTAM: hypothetical protein HDU68_011367 [Siphonaria sp. JEL0065]|nr:hypothetical protein HDU68_011367 [Siphonaria sp. JEL0065]